MGPNGLTSKLFKLVEGDSRNTLFDLFNCILFLKVIYEWIHKKLDVEIADSKSYFGTDLEQEKHYLQLMSCVKDN